MMTNLHRVAAILSLALAAGSAHAQSFQILTPPPNADKAWASGISPDGQFITGTYYDLSVGYNVAVRWDSADSPVPLAFYGSSASGYAVSDTGTVVGVTGPRPILWLEGDDLLPDFQGSVDDIAADGSVAVGGTPPGTGFACRVDSLRAKTSLLPPAPYILSFANGVNDAGTIAVGHVVRFEGSATSALACT